MMDKNEIGCAAFLAGTILGAFIVMFYNFGEVKPIDVYRGKTTLEITYKDSVPIDSVVVFK